MSVVVARAVKQPLVALWGSYLNRLGKHPIQTKMATSFIAAALGDAIAQKFSSGGDNADRRFDWARMARLSTFNAGMGCLGHFYYGALDKSVGIRAPRSPSTVVAKVVIDQLIFSPICTLLFYAFKVTSEARPMHLKQELKQKFLPTLYAGWSLWPAAHLINFAFVPTQHRILYANVVSVGGSFLLSRAAAGDYSAAGKSSSMKPSREVLLDVNVKID